MRTSAVSNPQSVDRADAVASRLGNLSLDQSSVDPIGGSSSQLQPTEAHSDGQQQSSGVAPVSNHSASDGANRWTIMFGSCWLVLDMNILFCPAENQESNNESKKKEKSKA